MAVGRGYSLVSNYSNATPADGSSVVVVGGRMALIALASSFPTTCQLQILGKDSATWINVGSNLTANGVTSLDVPSGTYRIHMASGTATGIYIDLVAVPYDG